MTDTRGDIEPLDIASSWFYRINKLPPLSQSTGLAGAIDIYKESTWSCMSSKLQREIGHDEFDPKGTLALIAIYFVIISVLWVFMYFVEFLGNDLTIVGTIL
jgi:hypothetical protein